MNCDTYYHQTERKWLGVRYVVRDKVKILQQGWLEIEFKRSKESGESILGSHDVVRTEVWTDVPTIENSP